MTDPPDFDRLELMERGHGGRGDNNDSDLFAGFAPVSRSASRYSPYGQISPKFLNFADQSRGNRPDPLPGDRRRDGSSSPVDLDETVISAAALPTPQVDNRSSNCRSNNLSNNRTAVSSRCILRERAKEKQEKKTNLTKSGHSKKYTPSLPEPKKDDGDSCTARWWPGFSFLCTFWAADLC